MNSGEPGIEFGTDGWRAIIADRFTFDNVRAVARAIAVAVRNFDAPPEIDRGRLVVGFDRRFLSREFALEVSAALAAAGYHVELSEAPTPSQTISFAVRRKKVIAGVMITASHNPAIWNGIKVKGWYGGSALASMYGEIAARLGSDERHGGGDVVDVDLLTDYTVALRSAVDHERIVAAGVRILHDPIHGVASGIPSRIVGDDVVETVRGEINPSFGGVNPEPIPQNLTHSIAILESSPAGRYDLAICNDGDADRLGILDERGRFVSPHKVIALLALYLRREKKLEGEIVKTFSTTRLVEKIAAALGAPLSETAVGFKYIADIMLARNVLVGGEESGGVAFGFFLPERDGILSGLLVAEAIAYYGKPLSHIVRQMEEEFGVLHYDRKDVHRPQESIDRLMARLARGELDSTFGLQLTLREEMDGVKLNFADGTWLLFRKSGTEPIIRIYCESPDAATVERLLAGAVAELG